MLYGVSKRLEDKFMYWRSQFWPFHVRLKVVQSIMVSMVSYYLPCSHGQGKLLKCCHNQCECCYGREKGKVLCRGWHEIMFVLRSVLVGHQFIEFMCIWWLAILLSFNLCLGVYNLGRKWWLFAFSIILLILFMTMSIKMMVIML